MVTKFTPWLRNIRAPPPSTKRPSASATQDSDDAMGLGKSWLSGWVLFGGVSGLLTAALVEFGPSWGLYPLDVHGKPWNFWTVPAFFPIMFELTVLFGAFAAFFAWQVMNGLPRWYHPMFNWERFSRVTNDGFFLAIEARDPRFTENG